MEDLGHGGLGWAPVLVVDPKLAAPRGDAHTNARREGFDGDSLFEGEVDEQAAEEVRMSVDTAIPETNVGFQLLLKMGWKQGKGLGRNEDGIVEPICNGVEEGVRLGLGKQEQDDHYTCAENVQRKRLETEIQATEDDARRERREALAEREERIRQEVAEIKRTFLCETCNKQYNTAMELEAHLDSYDHHHKKRLVEMKAMSAQRTKGDRLKKEARQQDRELVNLHKQIQRAAAQSGAQVQAAPSPPLPPPSPTDPPPSAPDGVASTKGAAEAPPPPPVTGSGISFGLGKKPAIAGRGLGGMALKRGGIMAKPGRGTSAPSGGAFALSDSDEEEGKG